MRLPLRTTRVFTYTTILFIFGFIYIRVNQHGGGTSYGEFDNQMYKFGIGRKPTTTGGGATIKYCTAREMRDGVWRKGDDLEDLSSILDRYKLRPQADTTCKPEGPVTGLIPPNTPLDSKSFNRLKSIALPFLHSSAESGSDCVMLKIEREMILKRLIRSCHGLTIVGDSISRHTFIILEDMLIQSDGLVYKTTSPSGEIHHLSIDPNHPNTPDLFKSAGVPISRSNFPIITFIRHNLLLDNEQLEQSFSHLINPRFEVENVMKQAGDWFPPWKNDLKQSCDDIHSSEEEEEGKGNEKRWTSLEESNPIVLSTGPHWQRIVMGRKSLSENDFEKAYEKMFNIVSEEVRAVPYPVSAYWRTTAPAHVDCVNSSYLDNDKIGWESPITGKDDMWNYPWFPWQNRIAKAGTVEDRSSEEYDFMSTRNTFQNVQSPQVNPPMRLFDVWPMSRKRPEAHQAPPRDCLHWCMVGVMNYWLDLLWTMVVEESRNQDYFV